MADDCREFKNSSFIKVAPTFYTSWKLADIPYKSKAEAEAVVAELDAQEQWAYSACWESSDGTPLLKYVAYQNAGGCDAKVSRPPLSFVIFWSFLACFTHHHLFFSGCLQISKTSGIGITMLSETPAQRHITDSM